MRESKERIEIAKIKLLAEMLKQLRNAHQQAIDEYLEVGIDHIETDSWQTMAREL